MNKGLLLHSQVDEGSHRFISSELSQSSTFLLSSVIRVFSRGPICPSHVVAEVRKQHLSLRQVLNKVQYSSIVVVYYTLPLTLIQDIFILLCKVV